jgi:hypothetical protein
MDIALDLSSASVGTPQHHDLVLGPTGDLQLTQGTDAIKQAVAQAIKQFAQDWFLDMNAGLPYRQQLFGGRDLSSAFEAVLQNRVLQVPGILGLLTWQTSLDRRNRLLTVQFEARCTGGVVQWAFNVGVS